MADSGEDDFYGATAASTSGDIAHHPQVAVDDSSSFFGLETEEPVAEMSGRPSAGPMKPVVYDVPSMPPSRPPRLSKIQTSLFGPAQDATLLQEQAEESPRHVTADFASLKSRLPRFQQPGSSSQSRAAGPLSQMQTHKQRSASLEARSQPGSERQDPTFFLGDSVSTRPEREAREGVQSSPDSAELAMSGRAESSEEHGSSEPTFLGQTSRPSSFYGLDTHVQLPPAIPRTLNQQPSASSFRRSLPDPSNWGRRHGERSASMASGSYASSAYGNDAASVSNMPPTRLSRAHLQPGKGTALLSHAKTLELYRANAKRSSDPDVTFEFASFLLSIAHDLADEELDLEEFRTASSTRRSSAYAALGGRPKKLSASAPAEKNGSGSASSSSSSISRSPGPPPIPVEKDISFDSDLADTKRNALFLEAAQLLKRLADKGHVPSQVLLADLHMRGTLSAKGNADWDRAFPLFVLAGKHGHIQASFRAGQCYENGWGCRKDASKAIQWYRKAATQLHAAAMFRLGMAEIKGELGLPVKAKEGFKWLKRAAELADNDDPDPVSILALHELGVLHEVGIEHIVFIDTDYAAECYAKASELGHAPSAHKLGECYEYGRMGCPQDSALSIHYYNIAAQQDHPEACFALTAWYLVGSPGVLPQSDTEAYLWAKKSAEQGLAKAEYACAYFTEMGIGTIKDSRDALVWYGRAAEHGDTRALQRVQQAQAAGTSVPFSPQANGASIAHKSKPRTMADRNREDLASAETLEKKDCIVS